MLTYWYRTHRYRIASGVNLTPDREREEAHQVIKVIHQNADRPPEADTMTFTVFVPFYLQLLVTKKATAGSIRRNTSIIETHLKPFFGEARLQDLRCLTGNNYITKRRKPGQRKGPLSESARCSVQ